MRRYVVGDIHGCHAEFYELIERIMAHAGDNPYKIIFVGDYVDRGPMSREVVEGVMFLQSKGHIALMGNHEDMILAGELMYATQTLASFNGTIQDPMPAWAMNWLRSLPKYYEDDTIIVAHAGAKPGVPMDQQDDAMLMWVRYLRGQKADLGKHLYHGHTPHLTFIEQTEDRTNVDTGCVYGGHLTAAIVGSDGKPEGFLTVPATTNKRD